MLILNKKSLSFISLLWAISFSAQGQLGIGTNNPHQSAAVEIKSKSQGLLPPRLTNEERDKIKSPSEGLTIYSKTDKCLQYYDGEFWKCNFEEPPLVVEPHFEGCPAASNILSFPIGGGFDSWYSSAPQWFVFQQMGSFFIGADKKIYDMTGTLHSKQGETHNFINDPFFKSSVPTPVYRFETELPNSKWKMISLHYSLNIQRSSPSASVLLALDESGKLFSYNLSDDTQTGSINNNNSNKTYRTPIFSYPAFDKKYSTNDPNLHEIIEIEGFDKSGKKAKWKYIYPMTFGDINTTVQKYRFLVFNENDNLWYSWGANVSNGFPANPPKPSGEGKPQPSSANSILRIPSNLKDSMTPKPATILNEILARHSTDLVSPNNKLFSPIFNPYTAIERGGTVEEKGVFFLTKDGVLNYYDEGSGFNYRIKLKNGDKIKQITYNTSTISFNPNGVNSFDPFNHFRPYSLAILSESGKIYSFDTIIPPPTSQDHEITIDRLYNSHLDTSIKQIMSFGQSGRDNQGSGVYAVNQEGEFLLIWDESIHLHSEAAGASTNGILNFHKMWNFPDLKIDYVRTIANWNKKNPGLTEYNMPPMVIKIMNSHANMAGQLTDHGKIGFGSATGDIDLDQYGNVQPPGRLFKLLYNCKEHQN